WSAPCSSPLSVGFPGTLASEIRFRSNVRHGCQRLGQTSTPRRGFQLGIAAAECCESTSSLNRLRLLGCTLSHSPPESQSADDSSDILEGRPRFRCDYARQARRREPEPLRRRLEAD